MPSITAGILEIADLAGYRNDQVLIRYSQHTPPNREAVRDLMPALFDLIKDEKNPAVRIVLGHFMFVYIHPYRDGNGRMGRFLMNVMLAAGGYPWTVIPVEERNAYMAALEVASATEDMLPSLTFLQHWSKLTLKVSQDQKCPDRQRHDTTTTGRDSGALHYNGVKRGNTLILSGTPEYGNKKTVTNIVENCLLS